MNRGLIHLLTLTILLAPTALNAQQCANYLQWPRWVWSTLQWVDDTGEATDLGDAMYGWQEQIDNAILFEPSQDFEDIIFSYATLPTGIVGNTIPHTQMDNTPCYQKTDYCGICMNAAVFYYAELQFDAVQLSNQYDTYHAEGYVQTFDQVMTSVASHELGHAMREGDLGLAFSQIQNCSATSVMGSLDVDLRCQLYLAQVCDGGTFASAYTGWVYDTPICLANPYCDIGGESGQSCT
jgi:hypothetical protein